MIGCLLNIRLRAKCKGLGIIPKSPRVRTTAVLAILPNLSFPIPALRFFESGDIFSSLILKKRQRKPALITLNYPADAKLIAKEGKDAQA